MTDLVRELVDSEEHPQIVAYDPELDDVDPDVEYGCAGQYTEWLATDYPDKPHGIGPAQELVNTSFGRLWPHCDAKAHLVAVVAPVSGARFPVHAGIAPLVAEGLRRMEHGIGCTSYRCDRSQSGAYNCRKIAGTNSPSNHSGALAIDINWRSNPFRKGARYAMPDSVWKMWESLGFYWGGRYSDFMHIEWLKTPAQARAAIAALGKSAPGGRASLRKSDSSPAVRELQQMLGIVVDGTFGQGTEDAVKLFQRNNKLTPDGVVGPATWAKLEEDDMFEAKDRAKLEKVHGDLPYVDKHIGQQREELQKHVDARLDEMFKTINQKLEQMIASLKGIPK